ncbi:MAG: hypothetical protein Q9172_004075 [Xanthocarpia lactea]
MTDPSGHQRCFQDRIHALSLLTSAQPKAVAQVRWRPNTRGEEKYLHYLDKIAKLIAAKADNRQAVATTYFRCPRSIRILWALGGSGLGSSSHLVVSHGVDDYVKGLRRRLFECDDLQEVLRYIVHECKPTILRQFKDILRCIVRDNLHATRTRTDCPTKVRSWSQELQMLVRETQQHLVKRLCPATLKDEYTANYDLFVQKVCDIDEGTSCGELADLLVTDIGKPREAIGRGWKILGDLQGLKPLYHAFKKDAPGNSGGISTGEYILFPAEELRKAIDIRQPRRGEPSLPVEVDLLTARPFPAGGSTTSNDHPPCLALGSACPLREEPFSFA